MKDYSSLAAELVAALAKQGADASDVYIVHSSRFNTNVRLGKVEKLEQSISKGLGLRVFKNGATALTFTTDFNDRAVKDLAKDAMEIVKVSNADQYNGLASKEHQGAYKGELKIFDESLASVPAEKKIEMAREAEDAGLKFDKRITNSNGAGWNDFRTRVAYANSNGFSGHYKTTSTSLFVSLLAEQDGVKQTDGWFSFNRFFKKLAEPASIGEEAARRAVKKLGGKKVKSQIAPIVLDPQMASQLLFGVFGAASGDSIYRKSSFLVDKIGETIASPLVTIIDDATIADGPGSRPFDAEGVGSSQVTVLEKGVLKNYVCDSYSARRLSLKPTGNAGRSYQSLPGVGPTNLFMKAGEADPKEIIKSVKNGLYVTQLNGQGFNGVTGDMSRGAAGFWIENGEITHAVQEITIAGNLLKMLKNIAMVGNDLSFRFGNVAAPTLLISEATIGGA